MGDSAIRIGEVCYGRWPNSLCISNGIVEVIVVPAVGRVMEFRWASQGQNVFWVDDLHISKPCKDEEGWQNFGGDKVWPSPQSDWEKLTGHAWPPPEAFDLLPYRGAVCGEWIAITSAVDSHYGIEVVRYISLLQGLPILQIATEFRKMAGSPIRTGIWVITQMRDAERLYALLPDAPAFEGGFVQQMGSTPDSLEWTGRLLSLTRNCTEKIKIGFEADSLLWVGADDVVRIDAPGAAGEFPDLGCRTEIYTNPDPVPYVELETLSPWTTLTVGDVIESTTTYCLSRRTESSPFAEARKAFGIE